MQLEKITGFKKNNDKTRENEQMVFKKHWKECLSHLSFEEQEHIAKKYYGGHYPWKG